MELELASAPVRTCILGSNSLTAQSSRARMGR
jgi:hypothetical protein